MAVVLANIVLAVICCWRQRSRARFSLLRHLVSILSSSCLCVNKCDNARVRISVAVSPAFSGRGTIRGNVLHSYFLYVLSPVVCVAFFAI